MEPSYVVPLEQVQLSDIPRVGGKNASLGELIRHLTASGVQVPGGFAITADAFRAHLTASDLQPSIYGPLELA
jgi:pyruvate,water dikinase